MLQSQFYITTIKNYNENEKFLQNTTKPQNGSVNYQRKFYSNEKNQRTFLFPMKGFKRLVLGMIVIAMIFTLLTYLVPNPEKITIPKSVELINDIRIAVFLSICVWMLLRIEYIFRTKKPWKYGLEYSIYFYIVP